MKIFDAETIRARRAHVTRNLDDVLATGDVALFFSGEAIQKPGGLDQTYPFLPHPEYFWLTGLRRHRGVVAYDRAHGWTDFVLPPTPEEALWEGGTGEVESVEPARDVADFESWISRSKFKRIFALGQPTTATLAQLRNAQLNEKVDSQARVQEAVNRARRPKDAAEVALVRQVAAMASAGYRKLSSVIKPGVTEREIQIEYEAEVLRAGAEKFPYDSIVGSGPNAAVLHAIPTAKRVGAQELVLIDAGADLHDYCVDITRTFSSTGTFTGRQNDLYQLVLKAQIEAIERCRPGTEWREVHQTAARVLAQGLRDLGILACDVDTALESEAISTFFPHGVGHLVGLKVRDVGGVAGRPVGTCCGVRLRVDLPLEENFLVTVEPGLYFVPALLDHPERRARFKTEINWNEAESWRGIGGVRIEDDILVASSGPENLTRAVPK